MANASQRRAILKHSPIPSRRGSPNPGDLPTIFVRVSGTRPMSARKLQSPAIVTLLLYYSGIGRRRDARRRATRVAPYHLVIETQRPPTLIEVVLARFDMGTNPAKNQDGWRLNISDEIRAEAFERIGVHTAVHTVGGLNLREWPSSSNYSGGLRSAQNKGVTVFTAL
jgi:hypothetical protein